MKENMEFVDPSIVTRDSVIHGALHSIISHPVSDDLPAQGLPGSQGYGSCEISALQRVPRCIFDILHTNVMGSRVRACWDPGIGNKQKNRSP
jgi:hypothetical protein